MARRKIVFFQFKLLFVSVVLLKCCFANKLNTPSPDFSSHDVVIPKVVHGRTKRDIDIQKVIFHDHIEINITIESADYVLELIRNTQVVASDLTVTIQSAGRVKHEKPKPQDLNSCQYSGKIKGLSKSRVALSLCSGMRGVIYNGKDTIYIEPGQVTDNAYEHYIFKHADLIKTSKCGTNNFNKGKSHSFNTSRTTGSIVIPSKTVKKRVKRKADKSGFRTCDDDHTARYVELAITADYSLYRYYSTHYSYSRRVELLNYLQTMTNIVNSMYSSLNIHVVLTNVIILDYYSDEIATRNSQYTLDKFEKAMIKSRGTYDIAFLVTETEFDESVVGKAYVGEVCSPSQSLGVVSRHSDVLGIVAATLAHEMGHLFGMRHDEENQPCSCTATQCIMGAVAANTVLSDWSTCSLKSLMLTLDRGLDFCLRNKPDTQYNPPTCGNGLLEINEQCDCGINFNKTLQNLCEKCCDGNCKFRNEAECATGPCCDLEKCKIKPAAEACRIATRECDLPEFCDGISEVCPQDLHVMDTTPCADGEAYCLDGSCQSHTQRCKGIFGFSARNADKLFYSMQNTKADSTGHCSSSYFREQLLYKSCPTEDVMCGKLFCWTLDNRARFYEPPSFLSLDDPYGVILHCATVSINPGNAKTDQSLVPDGAKCGKDKMCFQQKCVSIEVKRNATARISGSICPSSCSGHGICNSKGHCHCDSGFSPPLCDGPGSGGSIDSGPITKQLEVQKRAEDAFYIVFFGIVPLIAVVLLAYFYRTQIIESYRKKSYVTFIQRLNFFNKSKALEDKTILEPETHNSKEGEGDYMCLPNEIYYTSGSPNKEQESMPSNKCGESESEDKIKENIYVNGINHFTYNNVNYETNDENLYMNQNNLKSIMNSAKNNMKDDIPPVLAEKKLKPEINNEKPVIKRIKKFPRIQQQNVTQETEKIGSVKDLVNKFNNSKTSD